MMSEAQSKKEMFLKEFHALKQAYPQFISGPKKLHDRSKIEDFVKRNKQQCLDLVAEKMGTIVESVHTRYPIEKGGFSSIQEHERVFRDEVKKRCFEDDDISFLHNIHGYHKEDGGFSGTLVSSNFAKMHAHINNLFETFRERMQLHAIEESKQPISQVPQIIQKLSSSTELDIPFLDLLIQIKQNTVNPGDTAELRVKRASGDAIQDSVVFNLSKTLSNMVEVLPHDKKFNEPISITFPQIRKIDRPGSLYGLFIQKTETQAHDLDEWKILFDYDHDTPHPSFNLKSFSFMFLGDLQSTVPVTLKDDPLLKDTPQHQWIYPGLSLSARCPDTTCEGHSGIVVNLGFGKDIRLNEKLDEEEIICPICNSVLEYEQIEKIMVFNAQGEMKYKLNGKGKKIIPRKIQPEPQEKTSLTLYGATEKGFEKYSSLIFNIEEVNHRVNNVGNRNEIAEKMVARIIESDEHGNPVGSIYDLGKDEAFTDIKLLIGKFYNGEGFTLESFSCHVGKALDEKGFQWKCTENEEEYLKLLPDYDVSMVIPFFNKKVTNPNFVNQVIEFYRSGKGLMLWEDNDPVQDSYTTGILKKLFSITVEGNDPGQKNMHPGDLPLNSLTFNKNHDVFKGVYKLYEGVTISHPDTDTLPPPLQILSISSANHPNIMCIEANENFSRLLLDCGYTKLYKNLWDTAGTGRYVRNAVCWLAGASCDEKTH